MESLRVPYNRLPHVGLGGFKEARRAGLAGRP